MLALGAMEFRFHYKKQSYVAATSPERKYTDAQIPISAHMSHEHQVAI